MHWSRLTADQTFMPSWGSPSWETTMDTWHCLFPMHLMMGIRYGNSRNHPTPAGATLDTCPIICLHSLTRLDLPVKTITRGCGSLTRPKQPCVSPIVTADVTKGRTEIFKFDAQRIICSLAAPYATRPCSVLKTSAVLIYETNKTQTYRLNVRPQKWSFIFTWVQFWPSGILVACVCLCVHLSMS